jgi:predicted ribosomally synthesized peptide with nif11-like leader
MSVKDVRAFYEKVAEDKALQTKVKALAEKVRSQEEAAVKEIVGIASAAGFRFTTADLESARKERIEKLSEQDLQAVAGGANVPAVGGICLINLHKRCTAWF